MSRAVTIPHAVLREIAVHAREAWPRECCGLLIGTAGTVETVHRATNLHESRTRYLVAPEDHFAALRRARAAALQVVGAYHSHPAGPPAPSPTDRAEAEAGGFLHIIAGVRRLRRAARGGAAGHHASRAAPRSVEVLGLWLAAWRLVDGNFVPVPLVRLP